MGEKRLRTKGTALPMRKIGMARRLRIPRTASKKKKSDGRITGGSRATLGRYLTKC